MGLTKTEVFTENQNSIAELAKALSHPARIAILEMIAARGTCICNDLVEEIPLSQATISQHLKEMKRVGILIGKVDPPRVCYCVDPEILQKMKVVFENLFASFKNGCC